MQRWEYRTLGIAPRRYEPGEVAGVPVAQYEEIERVLDEHRADGWELVGVDTGGPGGAVYLFRRSRP